MPAGYAAHPFAAFACMYLCTNGTHVGSRALFLAQEEWSLQDDEEEESKPKRRKRRAKRTLVQ